MKFVKNALATVGAVVVFSAVCTFAVGMYAGAAIVGKADTLEKVLKDIQEHVETKKKENEASSDPCPNEEVADQVCRMDCEPEIPDDGANPENIEE